MAKDKGYWEVVGERGNELPDNERQLVSIARALAKKGTSIMIFDDATSALDEKTENKLRGIAELKEKTQIIIARRLSSVKHCERILVLSHGKLVGDGAPYDLEKTNRHYQELLDQQAELAEGERE